MILEHGPEMSSDEIHALVTDPEVYSDLVNFGYFYHMVRMVLVASLC